MTARRMRAGQRVVTAVAGLLLTACATTAPRPVLLPVDSDPTAQAERLAVLARHADVVYLGEQHDNPQHHERQRAAVAALVAAGARPPVAFEMLPEDMQPQVDRLMQSNAGPDEMARGLAWPERGWPDFAWYWPLFDLARRHRLPVIAADLDPAVVRRIAREGLASLGAQASALSSALPPDEGRESAIGRTIEAAHCGLIPAARIPSMVESWHARNVTMARRIARALDLGSPVVVIVGRGHQAAGGLPAQLEAVRPGTRQLVVDLVEAGPADTPYAVAARDIRDIKEVIWVTPPIARPDPCQGLRRQSPPAPGH